MSIFGLKTSTKDLPPGWTPLDAVAVIKCLDEDGVPCFCIRTTETLLTWEAYALLELAATTQKADCIANFEDEDDDEDSV